MKTNRTAISVGEIDSARVLVFTAGTVEEPGDRRYVLLAVAEDWLKTRERFPLSLDFKATTDHYIDDTSGDWFACYNVDCFDPPFAVVRARSFESAYEIFCDEFERWIKVDDTDAADYPEDQRDYNGSGTHIDASNVQIHPLTLLTVHV